MNKRIAILAFGLTLIVCFVGVTPGTVAQVSIRPIVLTFDNLSAMNFVSRHAIPPHARLSDAFLYSYGVKFSSGSPYVAVVENGVGHAVSGKNGIGGSTPQGTLTYEPRFGVVARFMDPQNVTQPATTDFVSVSGDLWGSGLEVRLNAFDVHGRRIATTTRSDNGRTTLRIAVPGIHYVVFLGTHDDDGVALDNFTFNPVTPITDR